MHKGFLYIVLLLVLVCLQAGAAWYWPFGSDEEPKKPYNSTQGKYKTDTRTENEKIRPKRDDKNDVSVEKVRELADGGNPNAQLTLGKIYFEGLAGEDQNYKKAFKYFALSAEHDNPEGMYNLGICYDGGFGCKKDEAKAQQWYQRAADEGVSLAQLRAATYAESQGKADVAFKYYRMMADDGDQEQMYHVALCMLNAYGTAVDPEGAVGYLLRAAEEGHTRSQVKLADCYHQGVGVACDYREMANWLMVAAYAGDPEAQAKLGMCYQTGRGVEKNAEIALKWYKIGAETDFVDALYLLGCAYRDGIGTKKDEAKALEAFLKAAEQGDSLSQLEMAEICRNGRGMVADVEKALEWYRKAAEAGLGLAQARYGALLCTGTAKHEANAAEGQKWLDKALDGKQPLAVVQVAMCYLNGDGVAVDRDRARRILVDAAARGSKEAKAIYELYFENGTAGAEEK